MHIHIRLVNFQNTWLFILKGKLELRVIVMVKGYGYAENESILLQVPILDLLQKYDGHSEYNRNNYTHTY